MKSVAGVTLVIQIPISSEQQIPEEVLSQIQSSTTLFGSLLVEHAGQWLVSPGGLLNWEQELHRRVPRECIDPVTGEMIRTALVDPEVQEKASSLVDAIPDLRLQDGDQSVTIDLLGGGKATVQTPYFLRRPSKGPARRRKKRGRGKAGAGLYPELAVLGIHERLTPAYGSRVAQEVVRGSLDEAQTSLEQGGVRRDRKAIRRVVRIVGQRALRYQQLMASEGGPRPKKWDLKGKRIAICVDGGKLRTRLRKPGPRRKSGGRSYRTDWTEPRVMVVYELDERGRKRRRGYVRYDASIANADDTFARLASILRELGAVQADQWAFAGDGAEWIWKRVPGLVEELQYDPKKVVEIIDFYHAVTYLNEFATHRPGWSEAEKTGWMRRMRGWLKKGAVEMITTEMAPLCRGKHTKTLRKVLNRFIRNKERMRYNRYRKQALPCGSGVVESAVRRIVNLRLKSPGIFWERANAEGLLHLRARYLSGDWDEYMTQIFTPEQLNRAIATPSAELHVA